MLPGYGFQLIFFLEGQDDLKMLEAKDEASEYRNVAEELAIFTKSTYRKPHKEG